MHTYALDRMQLQNFKMFEHLVVDFEPDLTILVGDNGSGKSTILDAARIAIASFFIKLETNSSASITRSDATQVAHDYYGEVRVESLYPVSVKAEGKIGDNEIAWERSLQTPKGKTTRVRASSVMQISDDWQKRIREGDSNLVLPIFAYYGTNRLWKAVNTSAQGKIETQGRLAGYDNCLDACIDYELMRSWFRRQAFSEFQRKAPSRDYRIVKEMLAGTLSTLIGCANATVDFDAEQNDICVSYASTDVPRIGTDNAFHYEPITSMSDGYRDVFVLLADIAFRMTLLNPVLGDDVLRKTPGVVLIDELDLHLHPKWQSMIVSVLTEAFPNVQFIATTHSPIVLSSVQRRSLRLLDDNQLFMAPRETFGNDVASVLQSVMDTGDRIPEVASLFSEARSFLDDAKLDNARNIIGQLEAMVGDEDTDLKALKLSLSLAELEESCDDLD